MYESFYGLREKPFQIVPSPNYLYKSEKHQNALTYLEYGLTENVGFILLTGEVGSGKTTLVQYILSQLGDNTVAAVIFNSNLSAGELLRMILTQFELKPGDDKTDNLNALNHYLIQMYGSGKQALLIVDEAQNLTPDAIEEVRMLSNLQSDNHTLLQIVLVGQPELKAELEHPSMRQVAQRIAVRYHLTGLNREDTGRYISYRLQTAGGKPDLFTEAAVDLIYDVSKGIPRSINLACQAALVYGYAEESRKISQDIVRQIMADNLGVGLESVKQQTAADNPGNPGDPHPNPSKNGYKERLDAIEQTVQGLQAAVENRLGVIERSLNSQPSETVRKLTELLQQEQARNQALLRKHAHLEMQYLHQQDIIDKARRKYRQNKA
ncbi:MAG: AAA family ATPase [Deltaproteobacteria bacterium]|nr:AAA family ATPase [Deltaproteobacteria bacterium]